MAIRVVRDEDAPEEQQDPRPGGGGGGNSGGGGLIKLLPILLGLFGKNPKLLILVAIVGGAFYLFKGGCNSPISTNQQNSNALNTGAALDPKQFDQTEVFESLELGVNNLPERVSLEKFCPPRLNQGQQGSCVAWSHAYAARSIMYNMQMGNNPSVESAFSPAFLYNQIKLDGCQGSYIPRAMDKMLNQGLVPYNDFEYNDQECERMPGESLKQKAGNFRIKGFQRLTKGDKNGFESEEIDLIAIKQNLAQGAPVTIGMMVGGTFMQEMMGREVWEPTEEDYQMNGFGGHAMCIIGYDDYKAGGAFQIMNSWGTEWGKNGIGWVKYNDFKYFNKEAYGLYPMGNASDPKFSPSHLKASFGLVNKATNKIIPLTKQSNMSFRTSENLQKGTAKFKIQVTNDAECYTYVYGLEDNNTVSGLFPYTEKHSPYCGIMGTRLFPKDYSLQPNEQGNLDYFVIVVSKKPMDYNKTKENLSKASGTLEQKVKSVFGNQLISPEFTVNQTISFDTNDATDNNAVAMIIEVSKN